jgi:hypothetical protein
MAPDAVGLATGKASSLHWTAARRWPERWALSPPLQNSPRKISEAVQAALKTGKPHLVEIAVTGVVGTRVFLIRKGKIISNPSSYRSPEGPEKNAGSGNRNGLIAGEHSSGWMPLRGSKDTQEFMKISPPLLTAIITAVLASTGLPANDEAFIKEGYRWTAANGPFACPAKGDLQTLIKHPDDGTRLQMVEQLRAYYYLVRGTMVKVVQEEPA